MSPEGRACNWPRPVIHIDPAVSHGRPMIEGISCEAMAEHVMAGVAVDEVAQDFAATREQVLLACWWIGMSAPNPRLRHRWREWADAVHGPMARGEYGRTDDPPDQEAADGWATWRPVRTAGSPPR